MLEPALAGFGKMYMYRGRGAGGWLWSKRQSLNDRPGIGTTMIEGRARQGQTGPDRVTARISHTGRTLVPPL